MKKLLLLTTLLASSLYSYAGGDHDGGHNADKVLDTKEAIVATLVTFEADQPDQNVAKFNGIKAWPVSKGIKTKIYLSNKTSLSYSCHRHDSTEPFECHIQ